MFKRALVVFLLFTCVVGGLFFVKWQQQQSHGKNMAPMRPLVVVDVADVLTKSWQPTVAAVGTLLPVRQISIASEVVGVIKTLHFQSAQSVTAGQLLVQLDDTVDRAQLDGLKAARKLTEVKFRRAKELLPKKVMSQSDYDEASAEYEAASAKVTEKEALIAQKRITAPFAGVVGFYRRQAGDFVAMGDEIVTLHQPSPLWVEFELPSHFLSSVAVGQKVVIQTETHPEEIFNATISLIHPSVQATNRALVLRAQYDNADMRLKPGLFVTMKLSLLPPKNVLMIPETAISYNPYGNFIFKLVQNDKKEWQAQKVSIETGERENGWVVVVKGLSSGDQVVRAGIMKVRDGQAVQLATQKGLNESGVKPE